MNRRLAAAVGIVVMTLSACGSDGPTGDFTSDPGPIDPDLVAALDADVDPAEVPAVQRNFLDGCVKGFGDGLPDLEAIQAAGLLAVCGCSYDQLVSYSYSETADRPADDERTDDEAAFDHFTDLEDDIRTAAGDLPGEVLDLIRTCVRTEAGL